MLLLPGEGPLSKNNGLTSHPIRLLQAQLSFDFVASNVKTSVGREKVMNMERQHSYKFISIQMPIRAICKKIKKKVHHTYLAGRF